VGVQAAGQVEGAEIVAIPSLSEPDTAYLDRHFREAVFPLLTPLAVDQGHPFPQVAHLAPNLAVVLRNPRHDQELLGCVGVPPTVPHFVAVPGDGRLVPIERVVAANLRSLFPGMEIVSHAVFRVILQEARARGPAVRLEIDPGMRCDVRDLLIRRLRLTNDDVHVRDPRGRPGPHVRHRTYDRVRADADFATLRSPPSPVAVNRRSSCGVPAIG
jgi:polyphosphate kinase